MAQDRVRVAVAANFIQPFKEIAAAFEVRTGIRVEATYTSSGNLYRQILNGAPYDLFLSADEERPARLFKGGIGCSPFVYAQGRVVLWSARRNFCPAGGDWKQALAGTKGRKIALCNPEVAPYGMAAREALKKAGLWLPLRGGLVIAQDMAQAFQYASTEAVAAGFCALSSAMTEEGRKGCFYFIEEAPVIKQSASVLKGAHLKEAEAFAAFLLSPEAEKIKKKYGYQ
jgi:molybdate transport system substrate-binding protein